MTRVTSIPKKNHFRIKNVYLWSFLVISMLFLLLKCTSCIISSILEGGGVNVQHPMDQPTQGVVQVEAHFFSPFYEILWAIWAIWENFKSKFVEDSANMKFIFCFFKSKKNRVSYWWVPKSGSTCTSHPI